MKKKKRMTRITAFVVIFVLCVSLGTMSEATSAKSKAMKAYKKYLSGTYVTWDDKRVSSANCYFTIAYVDNNKVPELIIRNDVENSHGPGYGIICTYKNGKVKIVDRLHLEDGKFAYYKKTGIVEDSVYYGRVITMVYKLSGIKFTEKLGKEVADDYWRQFYPNWYGKYVKGKSTPIEISKKQYNKKLKKLTKGKKRTKAKVYKNTAKNRNKILK